MAANGPTSAESKFARKLASNEAKVRHRAISRLRMYLNIRSKNDGSKTATSEQRTHCTCVRRRQSFLAYGGLMLIFDIYPLYMCELPRRF